MKVQRSMGDQHDGFPRLCHFFQSPHQFLLCSRIQTGSGFVQKKDSRIRQKLHRYACSFSALR